MFEISPHSKEKSEGPELKNAVAGKITGSFNQKMVSCPSILTTMSREMRTQMNTIVAFTYLLDKKEYSDSEREEFSKQVYNSCEQIIWLFDNFLDTAVIDSGNSRTESGICDLDKVFNDIYSEFREILKKDRYKDVILISENQTIIKTDYIVDLSKFTRVIRNLFQNALTNTKSGYIKVSYFFRDDKLTFFIQDSGQGYLKYREFLHSNDITQSLSRFYDIYTAVNIILTRTLVQMMEGSIWVECNGVEGSKIYVTIPVTAATKADDPVNKFSDTLSSI